MKIVGAVWKPEINWLVIECDCGNNFGHRSDRWWAVCDHCSKRANLGKLRESYAAAGIPARGR